MNLLSIFLGLFVLMFSIIQLLIIGKVILLSTTTNKLRVVLFIPTLLLTLIYQFEVATMLMYSWGLPAFTMTQFSLDRGGAGWLNTNGFCTFNNLSVNRDAKMKELLVFSNIYTVSLVTRLLWTIVIFVSLIGHQWYKKRAAMSV